MRLTSAGDLGIGASSPDTKLDVRGEISLSYSASNGLRFYNQDRSNWSSIGNDTATGTSNANLVFRTSAGTALTIAANRNTTFATAATFSSNVGIGTSTIVANDGTSRTFQMGTRLAIQNVVGTQFLLSSNLYYDGAWKYMVAGKGQAIRGTGESGTIQFSLSPTGTAGGSVTNMDGSDVKMVILESGNVGIGTSSPGNALEVQGDIKINAAINGTRSLLFGISGANYASIKYTDTDGALNFQTLGPYPQTFVTNSTERMRITSGGNVQIGASAKTEAFSMYQNRGGANLVSLENVSTTGYGISVIINNSSSNNYRFFEGVDSSGGARIAIYTNGDVKNTNNSYGSLSDIKLKENIIDTTPKLDKLMQVRIVNYNLKGDELKQIGVIAQELEQVFPNLVEECVDTKKDEETGEIIQLETSTKAVKYSVFVPMLIKAIQEQQLQIEELSNKIVDLESK
jgi:hypothetical protein